MFINFRSAGLARRKEPHFGAARDFLHATIQVGRVRLGFRSRRQPLNEHGDSGTLATLCERRTRAADAPAAVRGACLGALWSLEALVNGSADAVAGVRRLALPTQLGDFLTGLFALARDQTVRGDDVLRVIDEVIAALPEHDFLVALPSLRLAFDWFPPRERATIAERLATLHGQSPSTAHDLLVVGDDPLLIARGAQLDGEVEALLVRYALLEATS